MQVAGNPQRPSREQLLKLARENPEAIVDLVLMLWDRVDKLEAELAELKKNSRNSSNPPSSDKNNPNRPKQKAGKKGKRRKQGGQHGHPGHTLCKVDDPDRVVIHKLPGACAECGANLGAAQDYESRQVFDLPQNIQMEVTEHRAEVCLCSGCASHVRACFPAEVKAPVQYGDRIKALVIYLQIYQLLPCERLSQLCEDVFNCPISPATVANFLKKAGARAQPVVQKIKEKIRQAPFIHCDETGLSLFGKGHWLHTASTPRFTFLHIDQKRGYQAIKTMDILEGYKGWTIHDYYSSYYRMEGLLHGLCNAHHIRDLTYIDEELGQHWAGDMIGLLLKSKEHKERELARGRCVGAKTLDRLQNRYFQILEEGYCLNPEPQRRPGQRGRIKRGKALNLLNRFRDRHEEVIAFLTHDIPFDNNEAERDLRMMKTKQKISGCFRSFAHAIAFANLRSIIATARKQAVNALDIIRATLSDHRLAERLLFTT